MDALLGKTLVHYEVLERLGSGGMGVVYGARDTKLGRTVALKMLPEALAKSPEHLQRFEREARVLATLNHPNIGIIYGIEHQTPTTPMLVLERVDGETLASRIRRGPIPLLEALEICRAIAHALEAAHERGVLHRDLKPSNVMVSSSGVVKVLDFGLARWVPPTSAGGHPDDTVTQTALTRSGAVIGTPAYMSPEQIRAAEQDERADIFAFGCVLYECVTGLPAFQGATAVEVMAAVLHREPDWFALPGQTPLKIRELLQRCLQKDSQRRLRAIADAREEVEAVLGGRYTGAATDSGESAPRRHNLPLQLTSFIGRRLEIADCVRRLGQGRLVTLTGVGGCGKSRLMLRVAEGLIDRYPDGVWLVDLAPISDPMRAIAMLAAALCLRQVSGETLMQTVTAHLRDRKALVLFDNCEHMLSSVAEQVGALMLGCHHLQILATSREALHIEGEQSYPVAPLSLPDPARSVDADTAGRSEAVRLFVERANLVRPGFALDEQTTPAVVEICRRLDGIPLALELAAARMKILAVSEVRTRLQDRFRLLTGGSRTALSRHQTLRATIQWSYDHLTTDEQRLLRGLAVFAGGWTLEAAAAVGGAQLDEFAVMDLLSALTEKSLVNVDWAPTTESRYRFLETVRQYALEKLHDAHELETWRNNHLRYMLGLVERAEPELIGPNQDSWFHRLETEHENLLAALAWCGNAEGGTELGLRMTGSLWRFWWYGGHFSLGLASFQKALHQDQGAAPTRERAQALYGAAQMVRELGDLPLARDMFHQSLEVARALGDPARIARAYNGLGNTAEYAGDYDAARTYHEMSLALSRQIGHERGVAIDLHNLGIVLMIQKDYAGAVPLYEEALAIFKSIGDVNGAQATVTNLATIATRTGQFPAAREYFAESFRLAEELPSQTLSADSLECFAELAVEIRETELAARILGTAEAVRRATGYALSVENRGLIETMLSRIRGELGESRHAALDTEGRAMTFEAAVQSVQDWLAVHAAAGSTE